MMTKPKKKHILAKIIFSLLIFLIGTEIALQAAHYIHTALNPVSGIEHPEAPVILCVGDSHTYGTKMKPGNDYPARLQKIFERNDFPVNVINQGVPGTNTSELRRKLPGLMKAYQPNLVVVLICVNNEWNRKDTTWSDIQDDRFPKGIIHFPKRMWYSFGDSLRTVRFVLYVWNTNFGDLQPNEIEKDRDGNIYFHDWGGKGDWDISYKNILKRSKRDLDEIVILIRSEGGEPVFLTYVGQPFSPMTGANSILRESSLINSVLLIDNDKLIHSLYVSEDNKIDKKTHSRLFLTDPGETHLAADGYEIVAQNIYSNIIKHNLFAKKNLP